MSGAANGMLANLFGDKPGFPFSMTSMAMLAVQKTRSYERFSDVAQDIEDARIYEGIHFRFADAVGRRQGSRSANWAFSHFLRPLE